MDREEILIHCQEWIREDKKRVAIVILAEPYKELKKDGTREYQSTSMITGNGFVMASLLAGELKDNEPFAEVVDTAVNCPGMLKRKKEERK